MPRTVFVMLTEGSERKGANARYAFLEHVRKKIYGFRAQISVFYGELNTSFGILTLVIVV